MQLLAICPNCRGGFVSESPRFILPEHVNQKSQPCGGGESEGLPLVFTHLASFARPAHR